MRGWSGMVPNSKQSSQSESKGLHISQAGPDLIKKFAFLDADEAFLHGITFGGHPVSCAVAGVPRRHLYVCDGPRVWRRILR